VYYVQYVHARASSVLKEVKARGLSFDLAAGLEQLGLLKHGTEHALIAALLRFPEEVEGAAANCAPHAIVYYLRDVANAFHNYYNAGKWIVEETDLRNARLALVLSARQVIRNGLALLGISAPESM
jgi:arginyl-tRNA synthetase